MLTQEKLKEVLDYNPISGEFFWRDYQLPSRKARRKTGRACIGSRAGHNRKRDGYLELRYDGTLYLGHRLAWLYVHGEWPSGELDHINGNPADNRIKNLRPATRSQQNGNTRRRRNNKTGFKGVCKYRDRYSAYIKIPKQKSKYLGSFASPQEAHQAYIAAAREVFGEFARAA